MPDVLIRNVDAETLAYWKERAKRNGRSLQAELAVVLAEGRPEPVDRAEQKRRAAEWRKKNPRRGRSSVEDIREDRDSDHGRDW